MDLQEAVKKARSCNINIINEIDDTNVPGWGNTEEYTVVHYMGVHAPKFAGIEGSPGRRGCGAKYSVDWYGNMYQHCSKGAVVWAVGTAGYYRQKHPYANNRNCESIEMACKCDDESKRNEAGPEWYIPEETLIAAAALAAYTLKRKGQGIDHLLRHYDVVSKTCPAPFVHRTSEWDFFKAVVQGVLEDGDDPESTILAVRTGETGLITTSGLNIREYPTNGAVVNTVPLGTALYPADRTLYPELWFKNSEGWFSGRYVTGWIQDQDSGKWWYLDHGQYAAGWKYINGSWYYFNEAGWMQTGWQQVGDLWYYMDEEGRMQTGWQSIDDQWYFFDTDGHMLQNRWAYHTAGKNYYWLLEDGKWDGKTVQDPDQWESTEY